MVGNGPGRGAAAIAGFTFRREQAIQKQSSSGPIAGSVAAGGDAPLQKADVITYDTALLRQGSETVYANPRSSSAALLSQRRRYGEQLLLLLPALASWVQFTAAAAGSMGSTAPDPEEMANVEQVLLRQLYQAVLSDPACQERLTTAMLMSWHGSWLGNIYTWVGAERTVNVSKDGFPFATAAFIPDLLLEFQQQ